ncbi:hypothetical protein [Nocardia sp. NPDC058633]|uniref:hypothetical protein n=1 Tax=Nocardia sp. NPDC058633 TaxID=3346568 RepID=UPI003666744E
MAEWLLIARLDGDGDCVCQEMRTLDGRPIERLEYEYDEAKELQSTSAYDGRG